MFSVTDWFARHERVTLVLIAVLLCLSGVSV